MSASGTVRELDPGSERLAGVARTPWVGPDACPSRSDTEAIAESAVHTKAGRFSRSLALLSERLVEHPNDGELLHARALTLFRWGRVRESLNDFRAAQTCGMSSLDVHLNIAQACHQLGLAEEAERHAREAISLDGTHADAHFGLAAVLQRGEHFDEAIRSYERAFELAPSRVESLTYITACRLEQADPTGAETWARRALTADGGDQALSWSLLAIALAQQGRDAEALVAFDRAEEIESRTGQEADTFVLHGHHLLKCGRAAEAVSLFEEHLASQPHPSGHAHYGLALLTAGRYLDGWKQYDFRCYDRSLGSDRPRFGRPWWTGQPLEGKTLLVWAEQGHGDTIQFARFVQVLKGRGARVVFLVPSALKDFAASFSGVERAVSQLNEGTEPFDYQIAAMSVPRALGMTLDCIPGAVPYLETEPDRVARWRTRFRADPRMKVGVVWAGNPAHKNDRHRSLPASALVGLWDIPGVQFFSLQKERREGDEACLPLGASLIDLSPDLVDFRDTAAVVEALDLVIAVDTAVAHVAGALGKPCWLLLPANADFRWLEDREDSPWYPTLRLFRQRRLGDWTEVIGRVSGSLCAAVRARDTGAMAAALLPSVCLSRASSPHAEQDKRETTLLSQVIVTRYGITQYSPLQERLARSLEWYGEWLQAQLDLLAKLLRPGSVVVEAGAGIGVHTLELARIVGPAGHLLAYEADTLLSRILEQNLTINKVRNLVTVTQRGLVGLPPSGRRPATGAKSDLQGDNAEACDTVDDLRLGRLDLVKINESDAAQTILEGAADTLWRLRPTLFIAASDDAALSKSASRARDFGYRCWRMETALFNPANFNRREDDIFAGEKVAALLAIPEEVEVDHITPLAECVEVL